MDNTAVATSKLGFSVGDTMLRVAGFYPTIFDTVLEQAQNAIDSNATRIGIILNAKTRNISVFDNGDGVTQEKFEEALSRVGASQKEAGKLGRFGIGLISPLGKCREFTFASCSKTDPRGYKRWTFNTESIRKQKTDVNIPLEVLEHYSFNPKANVVKTKANAKDRPRDVTEVPWRTRVVVHDYSEDRLIGRIDSLESLVEGIFDRFGTTMRKKKIFLSVKFVDKNGKTHERENIPPPEYTGRPLDEVVLEESDAGTVLFRLYITRKTTSGRKGRVMVGELDNDFRFPFSDFARTAAGKLISDECRQALQSGALEGEILSSYVELDASRTKFVNNAACMGFCVAIEQWFKDHGKAHMKAIKDATEDERLQGLAVRSMRVMQELVKLPQFQVLRNVINGFKRGTVGEGHHPPDPDKIAGTQKEPAITTAAGTPSPRPDSGSGESTPKKLPENENPEHEPFTVAGPRGQHRTLVKNDSLGLQFSHTVMEGSDKLYVLDVREGVLHFNIRHPLWVQCEDNDRRVMQLQEQIAIQALMLLTLPDDWQEIARTAYDEQLTVFVHLLLNSSSYNMRPVVAGS